MKCRREKFKDTTIAFSPGPRTYQLAYEGRQYARVQLETLTGALNRTSNQATAPTTSPHLGRRANCSTMAATAGDAALQDPFSPSTVTTAIEPPKPRPESVTAPLHRPTFTQVLSAADLSAVLSSTATEDDDDDASEAVGQLPSAPPISHSLLASPDFDASSFLLARRLTPLDQLRSELREYLASLKQSLVGVINDEYEAFIGLSLGLKQAHVSQSLARVRKPVLQVRNEVVRVQDELTAMQDEMSSVLEQRKEAREAKALLRRLLATDEAVEKVEALLNLDSPPSSSSNSLKKPRRATMCVAVGFLTRKRSLTHALRKAARWSRILPRSDSNGSRASTLTCNTSSTAPDPPSLLSVRSNRSVSPFFLLFFLVLLLLTGLCINVAAHREDHTSPSRGAVRPTRRSPRLSTNLCLSRLLKQHYPGELVPSRSPHDATDVPLPRNGARSGRDHEDGTRPAVCATDGHARESRRGETVAAVAGAEHRLLYDNYGW